MRKNVRNLNAEINVTPFLDVLLVLIITFLAAVSARKLTTLQSVFSGRPEKVIQVAGHREAHYQDVLSAMDVARSAGVKVISLPPGDTYLAR